MAGFNGIFGIGGIANMRQNHAIGSAIKRIENVFVARRLRTDQNRLAACARCQYAKVKRSAVERGVLGIKHEAIETREAQYFHDMRMRCFDPCASK
jgi:hypothetical protein